MQRWIWVFLVLLVIVNGPAGDGEAGGDQTGTITGVVKYVGTPPPPKELPLTKDTDVCGEWKLSRELIVGFDQGIQDAVVRVVNITGEPPQPARAPTLVQMRCGFSPHLLLIPAGGSVDILNTDGFLHNIHTYSVENPAINVAQPGFIVRMTLRFQSPERVRVTCDLHPMDAWIVVMDHPYYAVTDQKGTFTLTGVPAGTYTLEVWHARLGRQTKDVVVRPGQETAVTFRLTEEGPRSEGIR